MKIKLIYIKAVIVYLTYALSTKYVFLKSITGNGEMKSIFSHIFLSAFFALLFLYIFDNDEFFDFAKDIEKKEIKKEKKFEKKYLHYGKLFTSVTILILSGPMIGALAFHFLLRRYSQRYLLIGIVAMLASIAWLIVLRSGFVYMIPVAFK